MLQGLDAAGELCIVADDRWIPLPKLARELGVERHAMNRWANQGWIRGKQTDTGRWLVDPASIPAELLNEYRANRAKMAQTLTGSASGPPAEEWAALRRQVTELMDMVRQKDALIAKLIDRN